MGSGDVGKGAGVDDVVADGVLIGAPEVLGVSGCRSSRVEGLVSGAEMTAHEAEVDAGVEEKDEEETRSDDGAATAGLVLSEGGDVSSEWVMRGVEVVFCFVLMGGGRLLLADSGAGMSGSRGRILARLDLMRRWEPGGR